MLRGSELNYIQETASSSLCLSIKRNKKGLDHDKRPHIQSLKSMDLILNMYGNCQQLSSKKQEGWIGRRPHWSGRQVKRQFQYCLQQMVRGRGTAARLERKSRPERGLNGITGWRILFLPRPVQLLLRFLT